MYYNNDYQEAQHSKHCSHFWFKIFLTTCMTEFTLLLFPSSTASWWLLVFVMSRFGLLL